MTSFLAASSYSPLLVLFIGLGSFLSYWGTGELVLTIFGLKSPSPWRAVTATLLGIQMMSVTIQSIGMANKASSSALISIWSIFLILGAFGLCFPLSRILSAKNITSLGSLNLPALIIGITVAANLIIALAPSTKIDELYYHMLTPSRIVTDGGFRFYRLPWEGAIWPQMIYQIAEAPEHALGYPDAPNVISWCLASMMLWFAWRLIRDANQSTLWAAIWTATLCVGLYSSVWAVTAGSHAMGDLAMTASIAMFCWRDRLLSVMSPISYTVMFSLLMLSSATAKISMLPLAAILMVVNAFLLLRSLRGTRFASILAAGAIPWLVFYCPIAIWTWLQSGSPFGPILSDNLFHSVYPNGWAARIFSHTREVNQVPMITVAEYAAINYSPLLWIGVLGALFGTTLTISIRAILAGLLTFQIVLIYWLLPYDVRFLGGLPYGLAVVFAGFVRPDVERQITVQPPAVPFALICLMPWLGAQLYYGSQFFGVSLGFEKTAFYERYVAFYADYLQLDHLLPENAVILVQGLRLSAVYAPRPIFFDPSDVPAGKDVVLLAPTKTVQALSDVGQYRLGGVIYEDANAVFASFRTPGRQPVKGALEVVQLIPERQ